MNVNPPKTVNPKTPPTNRWKALWTGYQYKLRTDQSFRATMIAVQFVAFVLIFVAVVLVAFKKSQFTSVGQSVFPPSL